MANRLHSAATLGHRAWKYQYTNASARTGASGFTTADLGAIAHQQDNDTYWVLLSTTPTWGMFISSGPAGVLHPFTSVNAATYSLTADDYILHVKYTTTGPVTALTLPTAQMAEGRIIHIKDSGGNAGTNSITIVTGGIETIDGAASKVLNTNWASVSLYSDGFEWFIIAEK